MFTVKYRTEEMMKKKPENDNEIGKRLARLRKEKGYTQKELAEKIGILWTALSDYERGKARLHDKIIIKLSAALEVSSDEILGIAPEKSKKAQPSLKIIRRLNQIEELPLGEQKTLLRTIDNFLKGASKKVVKE
jgi:transcriptional regulator with XRE-family HTH domain